MKKILLLTTLLLWAASMQAYIYDNYFTVGIRDTVWVSPCTMSNGKNVPVHAHFIKRVDTWNLTFTYPTGMQPQYMEARQDMRIPYINSIGDTVTLMTTLSSNPPNYTSASSFTGVPGYWYHNNILSSYGNVKWEPGDYDRMIDIFFGIDNSTFSGGIITIFGHLMSDNDSRGNYIDNELFSLDFVVVKGNMRGDVNGDDSLTITDLTDLISYLLDPESAGWDEYQVAAADVNYSGTVTIADVTALSSLIMSQG